MVSDSTEARMPKSDWTGRNGLPAGDRAQLGRTQVHSSPLGPKSKSETTASKLLLSPGELRQPRPHFDRHWSERFGQSRSFVCHSRSRWNDSNKQHNSSHKRNRSLLRMRWWLHWSSARAQAKRKAWAACQANRASHRHTLHKQRPSAPRSTQAYVISLALICSYETSWTKKLFFCAIWSLHVQEVDVAPAQDVNTLALHKHGHHLAGLATLFWALFVILIIVFHLFLFKLIYREMIASTMQSSSSESSVNKKREDAGFGFARSKYQRFARTV